MYYNKNTHLPVHFGSANYSNISYIILYLMPFSNISLLIFFLVSLKSSMDIQSSDGRALLLKYASSYVTKMKDHDIMKGLLNE